MNNTVYYGDAETVLRRVPDKSVNCCVTSPPYYGLRDYGKDGQIGLEDSPAEFIDRLVAVFREVRRVLKDDGTCWIVIGDSYAGSGKGRWGDGRCYLNESVQLSNKGSVAGKITKTTAAGCKPKDLIGIPWMLAFALRDDGWYLRQDIIWHKPNPMPENVRDRCTKAHEYIFLLSKSRKYYFDHEAMQEDADPKWIARYNSPMYNAQKEQSVTRPSLGHNTAGMKTYTGKRNRRDVWKIAKNGFKGAHFATFPEEIVTPCILAGCPVGGVVLDPFVGSGTTLKVATKLGRSGIGIELNEAYADIINKRLNE